MKVFKDSVQDDKGKYSLTDLAVFWTVAFWLAAFPFMIYGVIFLGLDWKAFAVYVAILFLPLALKYGKLSAIIKGIGKTPAAPLGAMLEPEEETK